MRREPVAMPAMGIVCALGTGREAVWKNAAVEPRSGLVSDGDLHPGRRVLVGRAAGSLAALPEGLARFDCRNNALAWTALSQIQGEVRAAVGEFGPDRVAVVAGTSTSGTGAGEEAYAAWTASARLPAGFDRAMLEFGGLAEFAALALGLRGPAYTISTACSSSAKVFASARSLIDQGFCDAVVAGGADSLCRLTVQGFAALELVAQARANPFSRNRAGLNLGEGAAFFLLRRGGRGPALLGVGESSDAHHMSAPDPDGRGAASAMSAALDDAGLGPGEIAAVNLHGTGTRLNDAAESRAVARVFGAVPCVSTKPLTGHALGAAGAIEAALCWLSIAEGENGAIALPPHLWDGEADPELPALELTGPDEVIEAAGGRPAVLLSNSFGFGGNNCAVLIGEVFS